MDRTYCGLAASTAIGLLLAAPVAAYAQSAYDMRLPAQDLADSLRAVGSRAHVNVAFDPVVVRGKTAPALHGSYSAEEALHRLIVNQGLRVRASGTHSYLIELAPIRTAYAAQAPASGSRAGPAGSAPVVDDMAASSEPSEIQEVLVTGSRTATNGNAAPTPVTVIGREQLNQAAPTSVADALAQVPEFRGSSRPSTFVTPQTITGAFLNLRGLGQFRVLTLLDGRRTTPTTPDGRVDVNTFPDLLTKRVDIVTGGASAAYGSDAVAGVVNFVLDDEYEGVKGDVGAGISSRNDNASFKARIAAGTSLMEGRLHLVGSLDFFKSNGVLSASSRGWDSRHCNVIQNPTFATDGRTAFLWRCGVTGSQFATGGVISGGPLQGTTSGTQFVAGGAPAPYAYGTERTAATMVGGDGYWNSRGNVATPINTKTGFVHAAFDAAPGVRLWTEGSYSRTKSHFNGTSPSYFAGTSFTIFRDNAYLDSVTLSRMVAANVQSFPLGRISPDWGRNVGHTDTETYRGALGFRAELGGSWVTDGAFDFGHTYTLQRNEHSPNQVRLFEAIDAVVNPANGQIVCRSALVNSGTGCAPLNPFGPNSASAASLAYVFQDGFAKNYVDQHSAELNLRGSPFATWAGDVQFAAGVSTRKITARIDTDALSLTPIAAAPNTRGYPATLINKIGVFLTGNFVNQPEKSISVKEAYAEVQVPLASDVAFARSLDVNAAARYAEYSTTGGVWAWKIGGSWEPTDWLRLRATRSRDVRAPNIPELYQPPQAQLGPVIDPRTGVSNNLTRYFVGNPDLQPEVANTLTVGAVFRPAFLPNFSASVDYYDIKIANAVGQLTAQNIVNLCSGGQTDYCRFVARLADGTLSSVTVAWLNQNVLVDRGVDVETNYAFDAGPVKVRLRGLVSYLDTLSTTDLFGVKREAAGVNGGELEGTPRWQASGSVTAMHKDTTVFVQVRHISSGLYSNEYVVGGRATNSIDYNHVPSRTYVDFTVRQKLPVGTRPELYLTINNVFNVDPPAAPTRIGAPASILGTNPTLYDVIGRQYNVGLRFNF